MSVVGEIKLKVLLTSSQGEINMSIPSHLWGGRPPCHLNYLFGVDKDSGLEKS
jgi:hypothetical protein